MKTRTSLIAVVAMMVATAAPLSHALYMASFQGLTFTFVQLDSNTLSFNIAGTPEGDWADPTKPAKYLGAFALKDLGLDFTTVTATATGPGGPVAGTNSELNNSNNSVDCNAMGDPDGSICFDVNPDVELGTAPINLTYIIDFSADLDIAAAGPHLKIAFTNEIGGEKVGSLYSMNVGTPVPEPNSSSLTLLGLAILGMAMWARRRRAGVEKWDGARPAIA